MAIVEARGLKKVFGDVTAVDGVDVASEEGEGATFTFRLPMP